jgi:hypothetical protein
MAPPIAAPKIPVATAALVFACLLLERESGALVLPDHLRAVLVVKAPFERLHAIQAAYKLFSL